VHITCLFWQHVLAQFGHLQASNINRKKVLSTIVSEDINIWGPNFTFRPTHVAVSHLLWCAIQCFKYGSGRTAALFFCIAVCQKNTTACSSQDVALLVWLTSAAVIRACYNTLVIFMTLKLMYVSLDCQHYFYVSAVSRSTYLFWKNG